ncbi:hypothetical protein [Xanthomonas theicola]|uniref:Uncharacterized protein n=1 Tax=Xanthomonas theicola TaxID=56464 RepID=A0A2S6ZL04_9XANT|nr:hypothetical protein [Xanthomonas theicola]PPT92962.1 hypothetical protein XthCFBP4691_01915 [Xanthomonas theicola]QNH23777.1 hypothetical protein G4Q83_01955 [Xanthomonas theicola]
MEQKTELPQTDWEHAIQRVYSLLTAVILAVSLTACITVLACRMSSGIALVLAQWAAGLSALLHFAVAVMLARLAAQAVRVRKHLQSGGKHTAQSKQLRRSIRSVTGVTVLMLLPAIAASALPIALPVVIRVPEVGMVFVFLIGALLMHRITIRHACQRLAEAIPAAQQAAQRTLVA